jgi:hypothetical protein
VYLDESDDGAASTSEHQEAGTHATSATAHTLTSPTINAAAATNNPQGFSLSDDLWVDMHVKFQLSEFRLELLRGESERMGKFICYDFSMDYQTFSDQSQSVCSMSHTMRYSSLTAWWHCRANS